ncbi:hypothetical protein GCM10009821_04570 [Aeromicrobium halocynthiae]|uniref:Trp biosynthesis-associated membrane protein n=1 Tax=Aeromicrobium halocynthiae TaxID=560557 RepID=A0ABN2VSC2_9ACTN
MRGWRTVGGAVLVLVAASALAGVAWSSWAEPGTWQVTEQGVVLTQEASQGQFDVEVLFVGIGVVLCLVWGLAVGVAGRSLGWPVVPVTAAAAALASLVAWTVGLSLGPPDPQTVQGLSLGDSFPDQLAVSSFSSFVAWPVAALGGLVVGLLLTVDRAALAERPGEETSTAHP